MDHKWKTEIRKLAVLHDDMILWSMMINTWFIYSDFYLKKLPKVRYKKSFIVTFIWRNCQKLGTYIIGEILAKDNLNIENLMQTFENLLLQNCATKFLDITYK